MRTVTQHAVWWAVGAVLSVYLGVFFLSASARLPFEAEFTYGESIVLAAARRVAQGESLYPPPDRLPLIVTAYTPLYYLLVGGLQRLFGDGYAVGRVVSLAATLGAAGLLGWSTRRVSGHWLGGLLAAGMFLTQNMTVLLWAPLHRVDPLALCLTLGGLSLATAGHPRAAAVPLLLAVLTKQSYVVAPLVVCMSLWPHRRLMLSFASLFLGALAAAVALGQALTDGWFLWYTAMANANPFRLDYLLAQVEPLIRFNGAPLLAASALLMLRPREGERLWRLYFVGTLLTLPFIGKVGASSNYWLELTAATSVLIGLLAVRLATRGQPRAAWAHAGLGVLTLAALVVALPGYRAVVGEALQVLPQGGAGPVRTQLQLGPLLADEPGEILTDDPSLAIAAGKPILFEFVIFRLIADQGLWNEQAILEAIEAQRFQLVVLRDPLEAPLEEVEWTAAVQHALRASYVLEDRIGDRWFYRPLNQATGPPAAASRLVGLRQEHKQTIG